MRISTGYGRRPVGGGFETFSWYLSLKFSHHALYITQTKEQNY